MSNGYPGLPVRGGGLPSQRGWDGRFLRTDGKSASWEEVVLLPSQGGNDGRFLSTDGSILSWQAAGGGGGFSPHSISMSAAEQDTYCYDVTIDPLTGDYYTTWDIYDTPGEYGVVARVTANGTIKWAKRIGTDTTHDWWCNRPLFTPECVFATYIDSHGGYTYGIVGLGVENGDLLWSHTTSHEWQPVGAMGGYGVFYGSFGTTIILLVLDGRGETYLSTALTTGASQSGGSPSLFIGPDDCLYVAWTDTSNQTTVQRIDMPTKAYGDIIVTNILSADAPGEKIVIDHLGRIYLCSQASPPGITITCYSSTGAYLWDRFFQSPASFNPASGGLWGTFEVDPLGGVFVAMKGPSPGDEAHLYRVSPAGMVTEFYTCIVYTDSSRTTKVNASPETYAISEDHIVWIQDGSSGAYWDSIVYCMPRSTSPFGPVGPDADGNYLTVRPSTDVLSSKLTLHAPSGAPTTLTAGTLTAGAYGGSIASSSVASGTPYSALVSGALNVQAIS